MKAHKPLKKIPDFTFTLEKRLYGFEKKYFNRVKTTVAQADSQTSLHALRLQVQVILPRRYTVGCGGSHIWIHSSFLHAKNKRLAIIIEDAHRKPCNNTMDYKKPLEKMIKDSTHEIT